MAKVRLAQKARRGKNSGEATNSGDNIKPKTVSFIKSSNKNYLRTKFDELAKPKHVYSRCEIKPEPLVKKSALNAVASSRIVELATPRIRIDKSETKPDTSLVKKSALKARASERTKRLAQSKRDFSIQQFEVDEMSSQADPTYPKF